MRRYTLGGHLPHALPPIIDINRPTVVALALLAVLTGDLEWFGIAMALRWLR